jgi:hypothetical protein
MELGNLRSFRGPDSPRGVWNGDSFPVIEWKNFHQQGIPTKPGLLFYPASPLFSTLHNWQGECTKGRQTKWRASGRFQGPNGQRSWESASLLLWPVSDQLDFVSQIDPRPPQY